MINIGIDAHVIGDKSGGNETYYKNIIENLPKINGVKYYIFYNKGVKPLTSGDNIQNVFFGKYSNSITRNLFELPYFQLKNKLNLLHTQYFSPFINFVPNIVTIHDICFEHYNNIFDKKTYFIQKKLIPLAARRADRILTVSEYSKKDINKKYKIAEQKIIVTPLAASNNFKKILNKEDIKMQIRGKFGIQGKYILTVGNLQPRKNIERLIKVFVDLKQEDKNFNYKLVIVGKKAWMYEKIFELVTYNNLEEEIILTDYVTDDELVKLYNLAELFVYPSIFEGFGLPVLEAMKCGTPVLCSSTSSLPEVLGTNQYTFSPFDEKEMKNKIKTILNNKDLLHASSVYGLKRSQNFSWETTSRQIVNAYFSVLKK